MNTRVLEHFQGHVFHIKRSWMALNLIKKPVVVFQNIRLCLKHFRLRSVMHELLHVAGVFALQANSYSSSLANDMEFPRKVWLPKQ